VRYGGRVMSAVADVQTEHLTQGALTNSFTVMRQLQPLSKCQCRWAEHLIQQRTGRGHSTAPARAARSGCCSGEMVACESTMPLEHGCEQHDSRPAHTRGSCAEWPSLRTVTFMDVGHSALHARITAHHDAVVALTWPQSLRNRKMTKLMVPARPCRIWMQCMITTTAAERTDRCRHTVAVLYGCQSMQQWLHGGMVRATKWAGAW
jgi:hypothetical protein